jgi:hypothetical protein
MTKPKFKKQSPQNSPSIICFHRTHQLVLQTVSQKRQPPHALNPVTQFSQNSKPMYRILSMTSIHYTMTHFTKCSLPRLSMNNSRTAQEDDFRTDLTDYLTTLSEQHNRITEINQSHFSELKVPPF